MLLFKKPKTVHYRKSIMAKKDKPSVPKSVTFDKSTDFSTNHRLIRVNQNSTNDCEINLNKLSRIRDNAKREKLKMKTTSKDYGKMILYYICLITMYFTFSLFVYVIFRPTIGRQPEIHGLGSFHGYEPQLNVIPMAKDPRGKTQLVRFDSSDPSSYSLYNDKIKTFLGSFKESKYSRVCNVAESNKDFVNSEDEQKRFCVKDESYKLNLMDCTEEHDFGFKYGHPCFFLTLNNHLNWVPGKLNAAYLKTHKLETFDTNHFIPIVCNGENDEDKKVLIKYGNHNGINKKYYPFLNIKGFHKGFQVIQFQGLVVDIEYTFICVAHTGNDDKKFEGKSNEVRIKIIKTQ
uniref:SUN domain-containing protein n=1 Tax=Parastrongyloides trichosuri TaxID=131310 RepID=A0A0N4Z4R1_PARTI